MSRAIPSVFIPYASRDPLTGSRQIPVAPILSAADCAMLGVPLDGSGVRPVIRTRGMWGILSTVRAIVYVREADGVRLYPARTAAARSAGTDPCLRVSVGGRKVRAVMSSTLCATPSGALCDVACLRVVGVQS